MPTFELFTKIPANTGNNNTQDFGHHGQQRRRLRRDICQTNRYDTHIGNNINTEKGDAEVKLSVSSRIHTSSRTERPILWSQDRDKPLAATPNNQPHKPHQ